MTSYVERQSLYVAPQINDFITSQACPGTGLDADAFFASLAEAVALFSEKNDHLLQKREDLQAQIDDWLRTHKDAAYDFTAYKRFLQDIGYLLPEGDDFNISVTHVDPEIATISGPQLVVPIKNARFALNAVNARWGSLYDALYGTDVIPATNGTEQGTGYNPARGQKVIGFARRFLDEAVPLSSGSHTQATAYAIKDGRLNVTLADGTHSTLQDPTAFAGYTGELPTPKSILLRHHKLHIDLLFDAQHPVGKDDPAHIADIVIESAVTTIMDCEDSVAAVDGEDKTECYANMLGLMKGTLTWDMTKGKQHFTRKLNPNRTYLTTDGTSFALPGRSLMLFRNVGHLMRTPAIRDAQGRDIPEGLLDAFMTGLIAKHDLAKADTDIRNSNAGSIYIVKPKMHGPEEVAFAVEIFAFVEKELGLPDKTMKIGIMDEERRTTVNLKECIRAAKDRVIFINTGFLDRTGDEIHTAMEAGPVMRKEAIKAAKWLTAYEDWNVDIGLACGFFGTAQIGKGMWPKPDAMADMLGTKKAHPAAGADCAWAPSPTAATLHAIHYHQVDVDAMQEKLKTRPRARLDDILTMPLDSKRQWSREEIQQEIENNAQGILGYVVRWIDAGIGCSKVPDITDTGLMEDRATLRISSQHLANWLHHGIVSEKEVRAAMEKMAAIVDQQNAEDPSYRPMANNFDHNIAFQAACDLVFLGRKQPSGYTEPLLHKRRLEAKSGQNPPM